MCWWRAQTDGGDPSANLPAGNKKPSIQPTKDKSGGDVPRHVKALKTNQPAAAQAGKQLAAIFTFMNQPY